MRPRTLQLDLIDSLEAGPMTLAELREDTGRSQAAVVGGLQRLVARGVAVREAVPRRAKSGPRMISRWRLIRPSREQQ